MAGYIEFQAAGDATLLVEVDEGQLALPAGAVKAGLRSTAQNLIDQAPSTLKGALEGAVKQSAAAFLDCVRGLPDPPNEVEVTFGLTVTGELGTFAIAKTGGEVNYTVRLAWTFQKKAAGPDAP